MHDASGGAVFGVADSKAESLERSIELIRLRLSECYEW